MSGAQLHLSSVPGDVRRLLGARSDLARRTRAAAPRTNEGEHHRADAQQAIVIVQMIGSAVCPERWSKHDQPEYPEASS